MLEFIAGLLVAQILFLGGIFIGVRKQKEIVKVIDKLEPHTKAKVVRIPKGDEKKIMDMVNKNKLNGKSTSLNEIYD